jgi:hypothetical protein
MATGEEVRTPSLRSPAVSSTSAVNSVKGASIEGR